MDRSDILSTLRALPDELGTVCEGLSYDEFCWRPSPEEWSILEACCHLRDVAQVEGTRIQRLAEEENPTLSPYDQEALVRKRDCQGDDPLRARIAIRAYWGGLAYQLEQLSEEQWQRRGLYPEDGPATIRSRAELIAEHAHLHLAQIRALRERQAIGA